MDSLPVEVWGKIVDYLEPEWPESDDKPWDPYYYPPAEMLQYRDKMSPIFRNLTMLRYTCKGLQMNIYNRREQGMVAEFLVLWRWQQNEGRVRYPWSGEVKGILIREAFEAMARARRLAYLKKRVRLRLR